MKNAIGADYGKKVSIIYIPSFPMGGSGQPYRRILHSQQQLHRVVLAPDQDGTKQDRRCIHATWFLDDLWGTLLWL